MQVKKLAPDMPDISRLLKESKVALAKSKRVDYYKVLGVANNASQEEIKKAYKKTALKLRESSFPFEISLHCSTWFLTAGVTPSITLQLFGFSSAKAKFAATPKPSPRPMIQKSLQK